METSSSNAQPNSSSDLAKLFIGGIKESMKEEEIRDHFGKFGEVKDVVVVKDRVSGEVRGFGFVEFSDPDSAERALGEEHHVIGERKVEVKRARARGEQRRNYQSSPYQYTALGQHENRGLSNNHANNYGNNENPTKLKKIFVGGLPSSITVEEFRNYFEQFGRTNDVVIMYDSSTHRPRGFGFITFDKVESVDSVMQKQFHELSNKRVEVKLAIPKDGDHNNFSDSNGVNYNSSFGGGRGPAVDNRQGGFYPPSSPRFGFYSGYGPTPFPAFYYGTGGYGGGYVFGAYGGLGYSAPYPSARVPWSGPGMAPARRSPFPYGNAYGYVNTGIGSYMGMTAGGGYRGYGWYGDDKLNQTGTDVRMTEENTRTEDVGSEKLEVQQES